MNTGHSSAGIVSDPNDQIAREKLDHPIIGLSLSSCVLDIATGLVDIKNVIKIVAGTRAVTLGDWGLVVETYQNGPWHQCRDKALRIFLQLLAEGKIVQPRVSKNRSPLLADCRHWVDSEQEIQYQEA